MVGADLFSINNSNCLCIVEYYKFSTVKRGEKLSAERPIICYRITFTEHEVPKGMSDTGTSFVSVKLKDLYQKPSQNILDSYPPG